VDQQKLGKDEKERISGVKRKNLWNRWLQRKDGEGLNYATPARTPENKPDPRKLIDLVDTRDDSRPAHKITSER